MLLHECLCIDLSAPKHTVRETGKVRMKDSDGNYVRGSSKKKCTSNDDDKFWMRMQSKNKYNKLTPITTTATAKSTIESGENKH